MYCVTVFSRPLAIEWDLKYRQSAPHCGLHPSRGTGASPCAGGHVLCEWHIAPGLRSALPHVHRDRARPRPARMGLCRYNEFFVLRQRMIRADPSCYQSAVKGSTIR